MFVTLIFAAAVAVAPAAFAQDEAPGIDASKIPATGAAAADFAPTGWEVEDTATGDLNGDGKADLAIKLIEPKSALAAPDSHQDRSRALVVALAGADGKYARTGVATKVLQCTACGGAFYGVMDAPANVSIAKGVVIVEQDHGSRNVTETTYRFRYDAATKRFILIGFDMSDRDRAAGGATSTSTNFLTGVKITTTMPAKGRTKTARSKVSTAKQFMEDVSQDQLEVDE
jgi:hypothetical protein